MPVENRKTFPCVQGFTFRTRHASSTPAKQNQMFSTVMPQKQNPAVRIVAVEPASSPLLSQGHTGPHGLQGIGANFVPKNYDAAVVDEILTVTEEDAYRTARLLARTEGIMTGITSGAALWAADVLARRSENEEKTIVALLPDDGGRYLSTPMWTEE